MQTLSQDHFDSLIHGARLVEEDRRGPKVYETADGRMVKLFRVKRRISSNLLCPYAVRFARSAARLNERGIASVRVTLVAKVPHVARQMVVYEKLPGRPLREVLRDEQAGNGELLRRVGGFIAQVHAAGVYFRSFHFANLLVMDQGKFGLIDVMDTRFFRRPLGAGTRARNFTHLIRYREDRRALAAEWEPFCAGYIAAVREDRTLRKGALERLMQGNRQRLDPMTQSERGGVDA